MSLGFGFHITVNSHSNDRLVAQGAPLVVPRPPLVPNNDFEDDPLDYEPDDRGLPIQNGVPPGYRWFRQPLESLERSRARERSPIRLRKHEDELPAHRGDMILGYRRYDPDYMNAPAVRPIHRSLDSINESLMDEGDDLDSDSISLTVNDDYDLDLTNEEEEQLLCDNDEKEELLCDGDEQEELLCDGDEQEELSCDGDEENEEQRVEEVEEPEAVPSVKRGVARPLVKTPPTFKVQFSCSDDKRSVRQSDTRNKWTMSLVNQMGPDKVSLYDVGCADVDRHVEVREEEKGHAEEHHWKDQLEMKEEEEKERRTPTKISTSFKEPLPPAKRPPTRPRRSQSQPTPPPEPELALEDDLISLAASVPEELEVDVISERARRIHGWIDETNRKADANTTKLRAINFYEIRKLQVFDGLCFHHFFGSGCTRTLCLHGHTVHLARYTTKCKSVSKDLLWQAYRYTLDYDLLYRSMYEAFLIAFGVHKMQRELLECVPHLLIMGVDLPHAFDCLIKQLVVTGLSYLVAVDALLHDDNLTKYPELGNVLLELLTEPQDLKENFPLIRRITLLQSNIPIRLADKVLSRILGRYPCDKKLCQDVYDLLFFDGMTDTSEISESHRKALETFCKVAVTVPPVNVTDANKEKPQARHCLVLFPDRPVIGRILPGTIPDGALHLLMSNYDPSTRTSIKSSDVFILQNAVMESDGGAFLQVFKRNDDKKALESFAVTLISYIRNSVNVVNTMEKLLVSLDKFQPDYMKDLRLKIVLEVTVMNLLVELDKGRKWKDGKVLIERFLDWDGLASSQVFCKNVSHVGRYTLLAKTLALGGSLFYAHEVLQCPKLLLTEPAWPWPSEPSDESDRNLALETIFEHGVQSHFSEVINLYQMVLRHTEMKEKFSDRFNSLVRSLLVAEKVPMLLALMPGIDVFADVMERDHLRSYLIALSNDLPLNNLMSLYEVCCTKGLYTSFQGHEKEILIRTDMGDQEILTILTSFFFKLSGLGVTPFHDLRVRIMLPESRNSSKRYYRSMNDVNAAVRRLMSVKFLVGCSDWSTDVTTVVVPVIELRAFLSR